MLDNKSQTEFTTKITAWDGHITMEPAGHEIVVTIEGVEVARSKDAILFHEGDLPTVYYIPRSDIDETCFVPSELRTQCHWKGEAQYLNYRKDDVTIDNVL